MARAWGDGAIEIIKHGWLLVLLWMGSAEGVNLKRTYHYYLIHPTSVAEIRQEMIEKGPVVDGKHLQAAYYPHFGFFNRIYLTEGSDYCLVKNHPFYLYGEIALPRLDPLYQYSDEIEQAFQHIFDQLVTHEAVHESLHYAMMHALRDEFTTYYAEPPTADCDGVKEHLQSMFDRHLEHSREENQRFDCEEYGFAHHDQICEQYRATLEVMGREFEPRESWRDPIQLRRLKRQEEACPSDQIIEPFPNFFYCIQSGK